MNGLERLWVVAGSIAGFLAVGLGAFGAHALRDKLSEPMRMVFETANRYHMVHALALLAVAYVSSKQPGGAIFWSGISFLAGITLFSGSLYVLAITQIRWIGAITPIGGLCFLVGWVLLAWSALRG